MTDKPAPTLPRPPLERAQIVQKIAFDGFADATDILSMIETLEAGNTPTAVAAVNTARTDAVAQCVYRALWSRLLEVVIRAYADARLSDRHAQCAFDLLKCQTVRSEVEKLGNPADLAEAIAMWAKCRGDHRRKSIAEFRDKKIAHWGTLQMPPPIINDIFDVSRKTAMALWRLALGTGAVQLSLESQLMGYREKADRFWVGPKSTDGA